MNFTEKQKNALKKAGLIEKEDFLYFFPRTYKFYCPIEYKTIQDLTEKTSVSCVGILQKIRFGAKCDSAYVKLNNGMTLRILWFHMTWYVKKIQSMVNQTIYICGDVINSPQYGLSCINPDIISTQQHDVKIFTPVYRKISNIPTSLIQEYILNAAYSTQNTIPKDLIEKYNIKVDRKTAFMKIHFPKNAYDVQDANQYFVIERLYLFAKELNSVHYAQENCHQIKSYNKTKKIIKSLPFELTNSQKEISTQMIESMMTQTRLHALIQGDVGCGKTAIAQYTIFAMVENGYQAVLIAPTTVLAQQHYQNFEKLTKDYKDFKPVLVNGGLTGKKKSQLSNAIKDGEYNIIIGTTAVLHLAFKDLGLIVVDEEHRFGVVQKNLLAQKSQSGINMITMSATPIPRSMASVLYTGTTCIAKVTDLPAGRKPVKTLIANETEQILSYIHQARENKQKVYIICPKIEAGENIEKASIETIEKKYKKLLPNPEKIVTVTGRLKLQEIQEKIQAFKDETYDVLISTTVVEVGVDVSNATVIIIEDADMFGLSQLHQLRGRVGRSDLQSYCILSPSSTATENGIERLRVLCESNDGFVIAEADLAARGPGEVLGNKQSGESADLALMLKYPNTFQQINDYCKSLN